MSFVKLFKASTLDDIENQINEWVIQNSQTKQDPSSGRVMAGRKTSITQTETTYLERNNESFQVLVTYNYI